MPLLGDLATEHAETAKRQATRRMIRSMAHHETGKVAEHLSKALVAGVNARTISDATDRAIVRHLSSILAANRLERELASLDAKANAAYIKAAGSGYEWIG